MLCLCIETYRTCFKMGEQSSAVLVPWISLAVWLTDHRHFSLARQFAYLIIHQSWNFLPHGSRPQPNLGATICAVSKGNFAPHFASAFWCFLLWAKNMNFLVHTEKGEVLRENYTWKLAAKTTICRINSQYLIDYILYDKSPSSVTKIFQYSSCWTAKFFFPLFCFDLLLI